MLSAEGRFHLACQELGWGNPEGGVWFVAIEEAGSWAPPEGRALDVTAFHELCGRVESHYGHGNAFRGEKEEAAKRAREPGPTVIGTVRPARYALVESRICLPLSSDAPSSGEYRYAAELALDWRRVAHANLYPLGKPDIASWPSVYERLFGFAASDRTRYQAEVRRLRFPRFREALERFRPQAIVCFGKSYRSDFISALGLRETGDVLSGPAWALETFSFSDSAAQRTAVLAPHWASRSPKMRLTRDCESAITAELAKASVRLP